MAIKTPSSETLKLKNLSNDSIKTLNKQIEKSELYNVAKSPDKVTSRRITKFKNLV
ncbi:hypothetical protein [Staphylococcus hominis]|uniref:hypothetical protein n=1 Tax=Staphylococcus hominis TaxID=1290 RepID=UPI0023048A72|nr:hypothetical protein [Staphylococcus hominis]